MTKAQSIELKTKLLEPSLEGIATAISILRNDGLVALPTETVYGLAGKARSKRAIKRIYLAKNRPEDNPLIWHVHDLPSALKLLNSSAMSEGILKRIEILSAHFWPGPLSMVAAKSLDLMSLEYDQLPTIAVRIPKNPITLKILKELNFPLAMPSANSSTRPSPTSPMHVLKTLNGRIDAVMKGGPCQVGLESTVVRVDEEELRILRPGLISAEEISLVLKEKVKEKDNTKKSETLSPGTKYLHYSPNVAHVSLVPLMEVAKLWNCELSILGRSDDIKMIFDEQGPRPKEALTLALPNTPESFAQELYNALYRAEECPERGLVLIAPPNEDKWTFIMDRLRRASRNIEVIEGIGLEHGQQNILGDLTKS